MGLIVGAWMIAACAPTPTGQAELSRAYTIGAECVSMHGDLNGCKRACWDVVRPMDIEYCEQGAAQQYMLGARPCPSCAPAYRDPVPK